MRAAKKFIVTGSIILTLSNISVRFLSYVYRVAMGRLLTPYEYGILNLALPLQFMIILLTSAGIAPSIAKFVSDKGRDKEDLKQLISSLIYYYTAGGMILGLVFIVLAWPVGNLVFGDENAVLPLLISALALPFGILVSVFTGIFQGLKKTSYMSSVLLFEQGMRVLFAIVLVSAGFGAVGAIGGSTVGFIAAIPFSLVLFKRFGLSLGTRDFKVFKTVFYFSIPTSITALSSFILAYADILLIGFYMAPEDVGIYSAASPASRLIFAFTMALYAVLIPTVSEASSKQGKEAAKKYFKMSLFGLLLVVLPAVLFALAFSNQIVKILFTETYSRAVPSFEILVVGAAFLSLFMTNSGIFQGLGKPGSPMKILLVFALLDILLNALLIPRYGIEGAAFATALASVGAGLVSTVILTKYLNTNRE
jgi:stage V sporulation protein B